MESNFNMDSLIKDREQLITALDNPKNSLQTKLLIERILKAHLISDTSKIFLKYIHFPLNHH